MYVILTKNGDNTWDAIHQVTPGLTANTTVVDAALESGLPLTGMNVSQYINSVRRGSTWDGTSFSGVSVDQETLLDDEALSAKKVYAFLCDSKVVFLISMLANSDKSEMFDAAFAGETILVKTETGSYNKVGKSYTWDGTELVEVE
jgi:hypothetical protein